jgi:Fic family protein
MIELEKFNPGRYESGVEYNYFLPEKVNTEWQWNAQIINHLLEKAAVKLGELNSYASLVPDIDLFIQLHVTKEAVLSSRIEGTKTNINEAILPEDEIKPERKNDWKEVNNYITALNQAITELQQLPISTRLIKKTHKTLLDSVRGEYKQPGEYRTSQNWIGGNSLSDATFIPPHDSFVNELMGDLENFIHNDQIKIPALIRAGIIHYQFETIHPFLDGNGRIGRLLITLYLVSQKILDKPLLYLSTYFEKNKGLYYDNLTRVREHSDMIQWLKYFLVGIEQTATQSIQTLTEILKLKSNIEHEAPSIFKRRSYAAIRLFNELYKKPFVNVESAAQICNLSYKAANDLIALMSQSGYLKETTGQSRNRLFVFQPYLLIFENK